MTSENKIKFICEDNDAMQEFPPVPASKIIPEWYKNIPVALSKVPNYIDSDGVPSIKRCMPVLDYLTSGYVLRNSYEINAWPSVKDDIKSFQLECNKKNYVGAHPHHQAPAEFYGAKNHYFKINQEWLIRTPPGYSCLIYQPHYLFREDFQMFPAIVDTDKHDDFIGLIGLITTDKPFTIPPGEPLVVIFPFKREDWKLDVSYDAKIGSKSSFKYFLHGLWHGFYSKYFHTKKTYR
jgi:hypothetical protein